MRSAGLTAALLLLTAAARAGESPSWTDQVRLDLGAGSPVGWAGLNYTRVLTPSLWVEAGAGLGVSGVQLSVMPRWAWPLGSGTALVAGLGPSLSIKRLGADDVGGAFQGIGRAAWLNAELGIEAFTSDHFSYYAGAGATVGLAGNYMLRIDPFGELYRTIPGLVIPQVRVGLGYTF